jgi:hypothetical protein
VSCSERQRLNDGRYGLNQGMSVGRNGFGSTDLEEPSRAHLAVFSFGSDLGPIRQFKEFLRGSRTGCQYR